LERRIANQALGGRCWESIEWPVSRQSVRGKSERNEVLGLHCFKDIGSVPEKIDLEEFSEGFRYACRQKKADQPKLTRPFRLEASDVGCLQTLGAAGNFEFNRLAFVQRLVTFRLNGRKVDENVLAGLALDEPKTLAGIKPLHCSLFSH
jgi:hypothetical protein